MNHKTKIVVLVATLLVGITLINVGFAAWVFSNRAEQTYEANVSTETVTDRSCILEDVSDEMFGEDFENKSIHFGVPAVMNNDNAWLGSWSESETENLTYKVALRVSKNIESVTIYFNVYKGETFGSGDNEATGSFNDAVTKQLIKAPACTVSDTQDSNAASQYFTVETAENSSYFTLTRTEHDPSTNPQDTVIIFVTVSFGWGEHFNSQNPYTYYNSKNRDDILEGAYTFTGDETHGNIVVNTDSEEEAAAHVDAFSSLYELRRLVDGLKYHFRFVGMGPDERNQ